MLSKDIFVPLTICIDQTRRALVIVLPCYGALEMLLLLLYYLIIIIIEVLLLLETLSWTIQPDARSELYTTQPHHARDKLAQVGVYAKRENWAPKDHYAQRNLRRRL